MRVAISQGSAYPAPPAAMLDLLDAQARQAAADDCHLLVLPELFLTGYNIGPAELRARAEPASGPAAARAAAIARTHNIALLYGYPESAPDGRLYNSALLLGPDGAARANYRKTHLFGAMERATFTPGETQFVLAEIAGLRLGILICYDVEFPELTRGLALRGADAIAIPTAQMHPYEFVPRTLIPTRAYENQLFVIYANRRGTEADLHYVGESCIAAPDGTFLARADADTQLIAATLDPARRAASRALNTYLRDRQPHRYAEPDN